MKFKEILNEEDLLEMTNFSKAKHKQLPANMFISYKVSSHCPRIKIQNNYGNAIQSENMFSMTIPDKKIKGDVGELKASDIDYFKRFIDKNKKALMDYWEHGINMDITDVIESLVFDV